MALTRPNLLAQSAFDATEDGVFTFTVTGGTQVVANRLVIKNNVTNTTVYDQTITTVNFQHTVPGGTLTNGVYYNAQVQTFDGDSNSSALSNTIQFYAYTEPTLVLSNMPAGNIVTNSSFEFQAIYDQLEDEPLAVYIFNLYNNSGVQLSTSGTQYITSTTVPLTLSYLFSGLANDTIYKIRVTGATVNNTAVDTGLVSFSVSYSSGNIEGNFNVVNNCNGGYITISSDMTDLNFDTTTLTGIRIKRRLLNTFDWLTLTTISMTEATLSGFVFNDYFNRHGATYEYAMVPLLGGIESGYIVKSVVSQCDGVFLCDNDNIFKFYANVSYDSHSQIQKIGVFEPVGRKYPIVVANAATNYAMGGMTGYILNEDFTNTRNINRESIVDYKLILLSFLTNKKAKILKDWNGNIWIVMVVDNPTVTYDNNYGMGVISISFQWVEQGDAGNYEDLIQTGLISLEG